MKISTFVREDESRAHALYAVIFTLVSVLALVAIIVVNTEADNSQQSTTVSNIAPSIASLTYGVSATSSIVTLNLANLGGGVSAEGTRFTSLVTATVTDNNGCGDIDSPSNYSLKIYRRTSTAGTSDGAACTSTNGTSCYIADTSNLSLGSCTSTISYAIEWPVTTYYFIDPTDAGAYSAQDWGARLQVTDDSSSTITATDAFEVSTLLALDVDGQTDFGTLALGDTSSSALVTITNTGNASEDFTIGYNQPMQCTQGNFSGDNVRVGLNKNHAFLSRTAMGAAGSDTVIDASIAKATSMATSSTSPFYAMLKVPLAASVRGSCSNTATYTAVADI